MLFRSVVLGYKLVASHDIALGRLVAPFGPEIPVPGRSYFFVCPKGDEKRPAIKAFRDWVFAEIEETQALLKRVTDGLSGATPADAKKPPRNPAIHRAS